MANDWSGHGTPFKTIYNSLKHRVFSILARHSGRAGGDKPCADLQLGPINPSWDPGYERSPKPQQRGASFTRSRRCQSTRSSPRLGSGDALPFVGPPQGWIPHQGDTVAPTSALYLSAEQSRACHGLSETHVSLMLTCLGRKKRSPVPPLGSRTSATACALESLRQAPARWDKGVIITLSLPVTCRALEKLCRRRGKQPKLFL